MRPPRLPVWLWLGGGCLLAVWAAALDEVALQPGLSDPHCPHKRKSATLLPSFTKTTMPATTRHAKTTPHPTTHTTHLSTGSPANHSTVPANHTTPHTTRRTTPFHTTVPINHTTTYYINHTTPHHPTNRTTPPTISTTLWPTDTPFVTVGNYTVKNGSTACLRLKAGLQVQVKYTSKAKQKLWGTFAVQPIHTNATGACSNEEATLELQFPEGFLSFVFKKNQTTGTSYLISVRANLTYQFLQAAETSFPAETSSLREFEALLGHSYQCQNRTVALSSDFHLHVLNERVQAFELRGGEFGEAEVCTQKQRSSILPIAVGVVLAILILIVLVAFAVGRRRSRVGYHPL